MANAQGGSSATFCGHSAEKQMLIFGFIKKTTSHGMEKMYLLYIFSPELHIFMTSLF
jgi:hypothetical protein